MPGRNQTGPNGMGPMTGRGMGVRNGSGGQGFNSGFGRGNRMGRGNRSRNGLGYGLQQNNVASDVNASQQFFLENELKMMKEQVVTIEKELENINSTNSSQKEGK